MEVRSVLGWVTQVLAWLVILVVAAVLTVGVLVPRIGGATPYTVLTGSMKPDLPPGTLAVVRPADVDDIGVGSVITYQLESGIDTVVTHRVVAQGIDGKGQTTFQTQGDANNAPDAAWVRPIQIRGQLWYSVPYLGHVNNALTGKERQMAVYATAALLLGYAVFMLLGSLRDRGRRAGGEPEGDPA